MFNLHLLRLLLRVHRDPPGFVQRCVAERIAVLPPGAARARQRRHHLVRGRVLEPRVDAAHAVVPRVCRAVVYRSNLINNNKGGSSLKSTVI